MVLYKSAKDALAAIQNIGRSRGAETVDQILLLSFMAGMYVALGAYLALLTGGNVPDIKANNPGVQKLLFGVTFTVGLMFIVCTGSDLFTGNSFSIPVSTFSKKTGFWTLFNAFKNITLTFIGNFLGCLFVGFFFVYLLNMDGNDPWIDFLKELAHKKVTKNIGLLFVSSIGCNVIVATAVFIVYTAEDVSGKLLATFFPITAFAIYGFEHVVANMFFLPTAAMFGADVPVWRMLFWNIIPVAIGNYFGGAVFVGLIFWYAHIFRNKHRDGIKNIVKGVAQRMGFKVVLEEKCMEDHPEEHHDAHVELPNHDDEQAHPVQNKV